MKIRGSGQLLLILWMGIQGGVVPSGESQPFCYESPTHTGREEVGRHSLGNTLSTRCSGAGGMGIQDRPVEERHRRLGFDEAQYGLRIRVVRTGPRPVRAFKNSSA